MYRELTHHGVKGQKWGVRRTQAQLGHRTFGKSSNKTMSADDKKKQTMKKDVKNRRTLSDAELKRKIERIKMEKQLKELTAEELSPGKKFVSNVMSSSGRRVATTLATGATLYAVKSAMNKEFDIKELASYMTPKPKK